MRHVLSGVKIMARGFLFGLSLRDYVAGIWRIARQIDDRRAETVGAFRGEGRFDAQGSGAYLYRESGILSVNGVQFPAARNYRWIFTDGGADIAFADGRPFHRLQPEGHGATALHDCPPDLYRVRYAFETPDRWRQAWTVSGPRKDYTSESVFTRLHPPADPVQSARQ